MTKEKPFFLTNKEWYTEDKDGCYILTDKAPKEAKQSYEDWLNEDIEDWGD